MQSLRYCLAIVVLTFLVQSSSAEDRTAGFPWEVNPPIAIVEKKIYREHPRPGAAAMVSEMYVGPNLERMQFQALQLVDDVPSEKKCRFSADNGGTWTEFQPLPPTHSYPNGVEVWEGAGTKLFDNRAGVLVDVWLRQINVGGIYNNFTYFRTSADMGRTWSNPTQLRYEEGEDFDPEDPLKTSFLNRNQAYIGSNILSHSNGTLVHCVAHANALGDPKNDERAWRMGSLCFVGRWKEGDRTYDWAPGKRVSISPTASSRGLMEPELAELADGRVLVVWRGSDTPETPGRKWFSVSSDGGMTLSEPTELRYDDGSRFHSPSSFHRMIRHSSTGKLYWVGNISAVEPKGNWPRYPLIIAEVHEQIPALKKETVTAIDNRKPSQGEGVQFSNFSLLENRETHELEMLLTTYGQDSENVFTANCYKYTLTLK